MVIIRHRPTPALERVGGRIGCYVVPGQRRRGCATQMLAQALAACQQLGLREVLVTRAVDNLGSRRVIEANGGALARIVDGEVHYWLPTPNGTPEPRPPRRRPCRMKLRSTR